MDVSQINSCPYCPAHSLDPMGHLALTCKYGGDVVTRHNRPRDGFVESCRRACIGVQVEASQLYQLNPASTRLMIPNASWLVIHLEVGSGWGQESSRTRPADILVTNWDNGISAAFDVTGASPLNSSTITEAGMYSGVAARAAELRKHTQNDSKCAELSWKCIPLAVECYGAWGPEALKAFSQVATRLAIRGNIYGID
eukprot:Em0004g1062a